MTRYTRYSEAEVEWLCGNYSTGTLDDTIDAFEREFGRRPKRSSLQTKASQMKLRKESTERNLRWTEERKAWFRSFVPGHSEAEISAEHERLFGVPLTEAQIGNAKHNLGVKSGTHGGRFEKGMEAWNKGKAWDEFMPPESQERSRATCFKKGNLPHNSVGKGVGYERISKGGYVEVKVKDGLQGEANDNFRPKHHIVWEQANGEPVPSSTMIVFADHDKRNFDPDNLVAVPRKLWAVISRNHLEYYDADSLRVCMNIAKLASARQAAMTRPRSCKKCGREFKPRAANQRTCDACLGREG